MPTLENIYARRGALKIVDAIAFSSESTFPVPGFPRSMDDKLTVLKAEQALFSALDGEIMDPARVRVGLASVVEDRVVVRLKVHLDQPLVLNAYQSTGRNFVRTGKHQGEWYVFLGFAETGWFVKSNRLVGACMGEHLYLSDLTQYLGLTGIADMVMKARPEFLDS